MASVFESLQVDLMSRQSTDVDDVVEDIQVEVAKRKYLLGKTAEGCFVLRDFQRRSLMAVNFDYQVVIRRGCEVKVGAVSFRCEDGKKAKRFVELISDRAVMSRFYGDYELVKMLGAGTYARVFEVVSKTTEQRWACKSFKKKALLEDEVELKSLLNEIQMLRLLPHANVMPLKMLYEGTRHVYLVCPLYETNLFDDIVRVNHYSQLRSMIYLKQLLSALALFEIKECMHRDIKPENVMLTSGGRSLVLADLGFATRQADYEKLFVRCGTQGYVAPEILQDVPYDPRVDVFSVGVIFYIMLTGNLPFYSDDPDELIELNARCEIDFDLAKFGVKIDEEGRLAFTSHRPSPVTASKRPCQQTLRQPVARHCNLRSSARLL